MTGTIEEALLQKTMWNLIVSTYFLSTLSAYFAKSPLLLLYVQLFNVKTWVRIASYGTLAIAFVLYVVSFSYATADCVLGAKDVIQQTEVDFCVDKAYIVNIANAAISLASDLIIFIIPLPIIARLNLRKSKRLGIAFIFFWGFMRDDWDGLHRHCASGELRTSAVLAVDQRPAEAWADFEGFLVGFVVVQHSVT
ncbi:unnamed protein product [Clonostachys rosea]|uniref:Rhodopsin domain-containing protein n=1 Tax=Bionectria ochroleuca TaxID=29856 RepID=A0ABY6TXX3_BIOOC|nr:unnamed protein product [Clonostachys rosea]